MVRLGVIAIVAVSCMFAPGCDVSRPAGAGPAGGGSGGGPVAQGTVQSAPADLFAAASAESEPNERPFVEPSRPFLTALAARNYGAAYDQLSSHCKAKMFSGQFTPSAVKDKSQGVPLENLTREQFIEWMGKMEGELGAPASIRDLSVFETDKEILAGKGDGMSVMLAIGGMPASVPVDIRRASIRAGLTCQPNRAWAEAIAEDLEGVTPEQVLSGQVSQENKETIEENLPYLNLKFVLVDEGGSLKVGYVEFMPPSMLD